MNKHDLKILTFTLCLLEILTVFTFFEKRPSLIIGSLSSGETDEGKGSLIDAKS